MLQNDADMLETKYGLIFGQRQQRAAKRELKLLSAGLKLPLTVLYRRNFDTNVVDIFLQWIIDDFALVLSWGTKIVKLPGGVKLKLQSLNLNASANVICKIAANSFGVEKKSRRYPYNMIKAAPISKGSMMKIISTVFGVF